MEKLIGQTIDRYQITERLGEGGMAEVYKAVDYKLDRQVAIKFLLTNPKNYEKNRKRFELEAKALAKLDHPNIVHVLDYGEHEGLPYLVMEYVSGGNLKKQIIEPMGWKQACSIIIPIAKALQYAHDHHILHRDVKPSNILMKADGTPMLTDFGVAKMLEMDETLDLTNTDVVLGTPAYMAPEAWEGKGWTQTSDIYSLACVFFEMITGRVLFDGDTPAWLMKQHLVEGPQFPEEWPEGVPQEIRIILEKALDPNPKERYRSGEDFIKAISNPDQEIGILRKKGRLFDKQKEHAKERTPGIWKILPLWLVGGLTVAFLLVLLISEPGQNFFSILPITLASQTSTSTATRVPTSTLTNTSTPTNTEQVNLSTDVVNNYWGIQKGAKYIPTSTNTPRFTSTSTVTIIPPTKTFDPNATADPGYKSYYFTVLDNSSSSVWVDIYLGSNRDIFYSSMGFESNQQRTFTLQEGEYYVCITWDMRWSCGCSKINLKRNIVWEVKDKCNISK